VGSADCKCLRRLSAFNFLLRKKRVVISFFQLPPSLTVTRPRVPLFEVRMHPEQTTPLSSAD